MDISDSKFHPQALKLMMTSSNGNIVRVTGPLCGEFTGPGEFPPQRPVTRSFDVFFDLRLNKRLSKQPWGWWFETPSWSLWRQCNVVITYWEILLPGCRTGSACEWCLDQRAISALNCWFHDAPLLTHWGWVTHICVNVTRSSLV